MPTTKEVVMPGKTQRTTELHVTTENELGAGAKLMLPLKQNKVNIECFCGYEMENRVTFKLSTSDNTRAKTLLTNAGYTVTENPVVLWTTTNTPGEMYAATSALAEARINTNYAYSTAVQGSKTASVVFATDDVTRAFDTLSKL
jgi:hypothetical protein